MSSIIFSHQYQHNGILIWYSIIIIVYIVDLSTLQHCGEKPFRPYKKTNFLASENFTNESIHHPSPLDILYVFIFGCTAAKDLLPLQHSREKHLWAHTQINIAYALFKIESNHHQSIIPNI